jgi:hypothetical protein
MAKKTENYMFMYLLAVMKRDNLFTHICLIFSLCFMGVILSTLVLNIRGIIIFGSLFALTGFIFLILNAPIFKQIKRLRPIILEKLKDEL